MSHKVTVLKHSEVAKLMTNELRIPPRGTPETVKPPLIRSPRANAAPSTSADKKAGQIKKLSKLGPKQQYEGRYNSGARQKYGNMADEEGYS